MEAAQSFEASGTAPNPTRPEPSARNSNTAESTWNEGTVKPAEWTEQFFYPCCPTKQVSAVQSQYMCVNGCSVVNVLKVNIFQVPKSKFLPPKKKNKQRPFDLFEKNWQTVVRVTMWTLAAVK